MGWRIDISKGEFCGPVKRAMGHGYFLMRGLNKVGAEMSLTILSYNIKRVINILGVKKMIEALS
jgi:hypothetical protein